ncbi:MAG: DUF2189 domain-containing protein [Pseudomonadota bacterium]
MPQQQAVAPAFPQVRVVPAAAPFRWLRLAFDDLRACPGPSVFYGLCFAAMGALLKVVFAHAYQYLSALTCGFLLLGPFLAIGIYEIARRREHGEACRPAPTLAVWRRNAASIGVFSLILTVVFLVWARASLVIFALFYTSEMPTLAGFMQQVLSVNNLEFLAVYFAVGLGFAALVFAVSVVSIPLMMDRGQDTVTAMIASFLALARNPGAMLVWAALIVLLTALGLLTLFIGLILAMPLVGLATWHAYRDLVA